MSERMIDSMVLGFCQKYGVITPWRNINSIIRALWVDSGIKETDQIGKAEDLMCLNNCILNIKTKKQFKHSPEYFFDSCINVDYDPTAEDCSAFANYLDHTFNGDRGRIDNIVRLGGYLLDTSCKAGLMFIFDGNGGSGKSTLIDIFSMFFTESMDYRNQVTALTLEELASGGFDKECLVNSRFNPCAEAKKGFFESEQIKKIITGDLIKASRKWDTAINFRPKTKIVVACNGVMAFNDNSDGIYRRIFIVEFPNQYLSPAKYARITNPEKKGIFIKDPDLFEKIKKEKSAILNIFIGGLVDLVGRNYEFVESDSSMEAMKNFKRGSDTVREYLEDNYEADEKSATPLRTIYENYRMWYRRSVQDSGIMKFRINEMGKRIVEVFRVKSLGQMTFYNDDLKRMEKQVAYPIRERPEPVDEIATPEEKAQIEAELDLKF
jgi:P4 family phage/plasmid primase-like protien